MIINLISGPRNVSTALMYSFAQRDDTTVVDEPFYGHYLQHTDAVHPGKEEIIKSMETDIGMVVKGLLKRDDENRILFLKNMAHHHIGIDETVLFSMKNLFLIRDPVELILSFSKVIKNPSMADIGVKRSWELYGQLTKAGLKVWVIDSGELLNNPASMLEKLCKSMDFPYNPAMLHWPAGARPEDGVWAKFWYQSVHRSTGFAPPKAKSHDLPGHLKPLYVETMEYYQQLYEKSIKP